MSKGISESVLKRLGALGKALGVWVEGFFVGRGYQVGLFPFSGFSEWLD